MLRAVGRFEERRVRGAGALGAGARSGAVLTGCAGARGASLGAGGDAHQAERDAEVRGSRVGRWTSKTFNTPGPGCLFAVISEARLRAGAPIHRARTRWAVDHGLIPAVPSYLSGSTRPGD